MINSLPSSSYNAAVNQCSIYSLISVKFERYQVNTSSHFGHTCSCVMLPLIPPPNDSYRWVRRAEQRKNNRVHGREEAATETLHSIFVHILKWLVEN